MGSAGGCRPVAAGGVGEIDPCPIFFFLAQFLPETVELADVINKLRSDVNEYCGIRDPRSRIIQVPRFMSAGHTNSRTPS